jgi:hypothetical protein
MNLYIFLVRLADEDDTMTIQGLGNTQEEGLKDAKNNESMSSTNDPDDEPYELEISDIEENWVIKNIRTSQLDEGMRLYLQLD